MTIEEHARQSAEQILGDESLTDEMDDQAAQTLLDWGIDLSQQLCEQTLEMDDAQTKEYLSEMLQNLRRLMRRTNKLIGLISRAEQDKDMIADGLTGIFESAAQVPGLFSTPPNNLTILADSLAQLSPADALAQILSLLYPEVTDGS